MYIMHTIEKMQINNFSSCKRKLKPQIGQGIK